MNISLLDLSAKEIVAALDRRVVGQSEAKKTLAIALRTSAMRYYQKSIGLKEPTIPISNIMLIGSTGTGKTMLIREIGRIFKIPVLILDASQFTAAGYKGTNVDTILDKYIETVTRFIKTEFGESNIKLKVPEYLPKGLIFLDEFDKLSTSTSHDEKWKRDIQSNFLSLFDGKKEKVQYGGTTSAGGNMVGGWETIIDTQDILFVVGGAFGELRKQLAEKANEKTGIGFNSIVKKFKASDFNNVKVNKEDVTKYGFMPEIMGRIHAIAQLDDHTKKTLKQILLDADNNLLSQYRDKFEFDDIDLELSNKLINLVIEEAIKRNEGARSLREVLDSILNEYLYNADKYRHSVLVVKSRNRCSVKYRPAKSKELVAIEHFNDLDYSARIPYNGQFSY